MRRSDFFFAPVVGVVSLAVYLLTLAPTVASNDAGRFQIAAPLLGTGHPTGYPTFILTGKLFTFLPFGDVAFRMNLMAAVFGALAAALAYLLTRMLGAGQSASAGGALLLAFSSTFWSQAAFSEVYTMHVFFMLAVALLMLGFRQTGSSVYLVLAGLLFGLSLGNNAGMVLFIPAYGILLLSARKRLSVGGLTVAGLAAAVGAAVYLYIPLRGFAGAYHNYGDPAGNWSEVWRLVSGARFQGLMGVSPPQFAANVAHFSYQLANQTLQPFGYALAGVFALGGVLGAVFLFRRDVGAALALVVGILSALLYALNYDIDDISVYYLPVYALLTLLTAVAVSQVARLLGKPALGVALILLSALVLGLNFAPSDQSDYYAERERSEATLAALPDDAILYGKVPVIPITYLHEVEGARPDVTLRWLDGGTLEDDFPRDLESDRPVFFISDESYNEQYLSQVAPLASPEEDGALIRLVPSG